MLVTALPNTHTQTHTANVFPVRLQRQDMDCVCVSVCLLKIDILPWAVANGGNFGVYTSLRRGSVTNGSPITSNGRHSLTLIVSCGQLLPRLLVGPFGFGLCQGGEEKVFHAEINTAAKCHLANVVRQAVDGLWNALTLLVRGVVYNFKQGTERTLKSNWYELVMDTGVIISLIDSINYMHVICFCKRNNDKTMSFYWKAEHKHSKVLIWQNSPVYCWH